MDKQTGLSDRTRFEAFSRQWQGAVAREAARWCADEAAKQLLTQAVLAEFQKKFADTDPPQNPEMYLRAQVCLVYSMTGKNVHKLEEYLAEHSLPEYYSAPVPAARPAAAETPAPAPQPAPPSAPAPQPTAAQTPAAQPAAVQTPAPQPQPAPAQTPAPAGAKADTFLDPVRTTLWTPEGAVSDHVVAEVELPDEEEAERSVAISFINTVLFVFTAAAFGFCFYETGFLQYLFQ